MRYDSGADFDDMRWQDEAKLIARRFFDSDNIRFKELPELDAVYIWEPIRGGKAIIIDSKGNKLAANSSVSQAEHISQFKRRMW